jgi:hypothetical protein
MVLCSLNSNAQSQKWHVNANRVVYDITTSEQMDPLAHVHHMYMISQIQVEQHPLIVQVIKEQA